MSIIKKAFDKWVSTTVVMKVTLWLVVIFLTITFSSNIKFDGLYYGWTTLHTVLYYGSFFLLGVIINFYHKASVRLKEKQETKE